MKWFILFAGIMITSGAMAVTSLNNCPGIGWVVCGVVQVGEDVCCAPSSSQCDAYCGGGGVIITAACKGQACEGYFGLTWKDSGNGLQTQCDSATEDGTCVYRCNPDGYYRTSVGGGSAMRCAECPENATCSDGVSVCCNVMHYPVTNTYMAPGLTGMITEYTCPECPNYQTYSRPEGGIMVIIPGMTDPNTCPLNIGACYIPVNTYSSDSNGKFQIVNGNCHYEE